MRQFSDVKISNTHIIINDDGGIVGKYDKLHMFDVELSSQTTKESSYVEKGKKIVPPIPTPVGNVGLSVVSFFENCILRLLRIENCARFS